MAVAVELLLQSFVAKDDPSLVLPLIGNHNLCMVVHAWSLCRVRLSPPDSADGLVLLCDADLWDMLWSWCEWDQYHLGMITGLGIGVISLMEMAKQARLIYPDGTISPSATKYLRTVVGTELTRLLRMTGKKDKDKEKDK